jgi:replication fork clamp-binding protein CrfC
MMMFGMLTSLAGLPMMNPLAVGAGLLLGRKAYKEDQENRLGRARGEAKMHMRRFVDDVSFVVTKESRDRLKLVQRQLRDHYREIASQASRSLNESLQATIASARMKDVESSARIKELERQLTIVRAVTEHTVKLSGRSDPKTPASPQRPPAVAAVG